MKRFLIKLALFMLIVSTTHADDHKKTVTAVLVHGAFADGSSWNKVIPLLQERGMKTIAVQNPLTSLKDDVDFTLRAIEEAEGDIVLVGHSWGGMVITEAGNHPKVKSLVYVAGIAPPPQTSIKEILNEHHGVKKMQNVPGFLNPVIDKHGFISLSEETIINYFAEDIDVSEAKLIAATQGRFYQGTLTEKIKQVAWKSKPTWYIVSSKDQMIAPSLLKEMAEKIEAKTYELPTSHVPMLSKPVDTAKIIVEAAGVF